MTSKRIATSPANKAISQLPQYCELGWWVDQVASILTAAGFDASELSGIYCGETGRHTAEIGDRRFFHMTWFKMPSGRYEMVGYIGS